MKTLVILLVLVGDLAVTKAQGSWNLKYLPIDSLNNTWIGREVRLDFKSGNSDILNQPVNAIKIRDLLSQKDTVALKVDGRLSKYIEDWRLYPDHGVLSEQSLRDIADSSIIKEMYIESVEDTFVSIKVNIYYTRKLQSEQKKIQHIKIVSIDKRNVKGFLFK